LTDEEGKRRREIRGEGAYKKGERERGGRAVSLLSISFFSYPGYSACSGIPTTYNVTSDLTISVTANFTTENPDSQCKNFRVGTFPVSQFQYRTRRLHPR
jgi:hypothetical protein